MALVTSGELERWGKTTTARDKLGELLSRLIHAGIPLQDIRKIRFLADESNQLAGWDGLLDCNSSVTWIPSGTSVWELGTGNNPRGKIKKDFDTRLTKKLPSGWLQNITSYIAVTLNKLDDLSELENQLKQDSCWKDVKVCDAQTIADWVQRFQSVQAWLQEQNVGPPPSVRTLETKWKEWSEGTHPVVSTGLVLTDREHLAQKLRDALKSGGLINVRADSSDEAIAFIFAVLENSEAAFREHHLARSIVVRGKDDANHLQDTEPLFVILSPPASEKAQMLTRVGHTVINALGNSSLTQKVDFHLTRPLRSSFTKALIEMGLAEEQAKVEARACGSSPAVWRVWNNVQQGDVSSDIPNWAKPENADLVVPAVLLGGWSERFEGDKEVIKTITGHEFEKYRDRLQLFLSEDHPLLIKLDDTWLVTAPATAFALVVNQITTGNLENLSDIAKEIFEEIDPAIELEPDERPYASLHTKGTRYSRWLCDGVAETLLRIVVLGERLESDGRVPENQTCQSYVDHLIRSLRGLNENWRLLASLRDQLPVLAEAAPNPLLEALDHLLRGDPENIVPIFAEGDSMFGYSLHSSLLWALETLAWEPKYLGRVGLILAQLAKIDPGGRLSNRPINSLTEILLAWHPGTCASLDQRLQAIDLILEREPKIGWALLNSLMPRPQQISHPTHEPIWKDFARSQKEPLTRKSVWITYQQYVERAIRHAGKEHLRWKELIEIYPNVSESHQQAIEAGLKEIAKAKLTNDTRKSMWETLRRFVSRHREFPDAAWALLSDRLDSLDNITALFSPKDHVTRISWLFDEHFPDIPFPKHDLDETKLQIKKLRTEALKKIWNDGGIDELLPLIDNVTLPGVVSPLLLELLPDECAAMSVFQKTNQGSNNQQVFAKCLSQEAFNRFGNEWTNLILTKAKELGWPPDAITNAFVYYPDSVETFDLVNSLGSDVERRYWEIRYGWIRSEDNRALITAIEKLRSVGRALDVIAFGPKTLSKLDSDSLFELIDEALQELNEGKSSESTGDIGYYIEELFNWLRSRDDIDRNSLARREYAYLPLLTRYYGKKNLALHDLLSTDAGFFIEVICDIYKPASPQEESEQPSEQQRLRAEFGWKLLDSWSHPPGVNKNNHVDGAKLRDWVEQARNLATEKDRLDIADQNIGIILYYFPSDPSDSAWPHIELRKLLEDLQNDQIERGVELEQFNSRGTVSKAVFEGGDQERELAQKWSNWAESLGARWPRTRAMLERIADSWERDAKREDVRAEKDRHRFS